MTYIKMLMSMMIFMIFLGWLLGEMSGESYVLLSPITWTIITIEVGAVIGLANTPVLKGGAMVVLFATMVGTFFVDLFFNQMPIVWGILFVPMYIAMGFMMMEAGKG